jgi:hypothetical protein
MQTDEKDIILKRDNEFVVVSGMRRTSYGIGFIEEDVVMYAAPDVTPDRDLALRLVRLFNELDLSPIHIYDVLEDMLPQ